MVSAIVSPFGRRNLRMTTDCWGVRTYAGFLELFPLVQAGGHTESTGRVPDSAADPPTIPASSSNSGILCCGEGTGLSKIFFKPERVLPETVIRAAERNLPAELNLPGRQTATLPAICDNAIFLGPRISPIPSLFWEKTYQFPLKTKQPTLKQAYNNPKRATLS